MTSPATPSLDAAARARWGRRAQLLATVGWHWADPVAGLVIAVVAAKEGRDAWRGEGCCAPIGQAHAGGCEDCAAGDACECGPAEPQLLTITAGDPPDWC